MDSRLDSLFRTTFQPTRESDTWLGIKREEPDNNQKKKGDGQRKDSGPEPEDVATLSVLSLHDFLKNLLQQAGESFISTAGETLLSQDPDADLPLVTNPAATKAAQAYQTTARAAPGQRIDFAEHKAPPAPSGLAVKLSADELRVIHKLLDDVEALGQRGIASIALHPADNFLESLVNGVKEAGQP